MFEIILVFFVGTSSLSESRLVPSYFLQKHYNIRKPICKNCPIECLHSKRDDVLPMPKQITTCYRTFPMLYEHDQYFWSHVVGFGNIDEDFHEVEEGPFL